LGHIPQGDDPVQGGDGLCGTFLFEFPMGNAPQLYNNNATSSSSAKPSLVTSMDGLSVDTIRSGSPTPPSVGAISLMPPRSDSPTPSCNSEKSLMGRGGSVKNTYKDQILEKQEIEADAEKRRNRLYSSFDSIQQEGEPFSLHHRVDSDDESDNDNEEEDDVVKDSDIELTVLGDNNDPENAGRVAGGLAGEDDDTLTQNYIKQQMKLLIAEKKKAVRLEKKKSKSYFSFLGDLVSVHYNLRLVLQDSVGENRWNTTEIVLFRSKSPYSAGHSSQPIPNRDSGGEHTPPLHAMAEV
jgi:hypothetical protein